MTPVAIIGGAIAGLARSQRIAESYLGGGWGGYPRVQTVWTIGRAFADALLEQQS